MDVILKPEWVAPPMDEESEVEDDERRRGRGVKSSGYSRSIPAASKRLEWRS